MIYYNPQLMPDDAAITLFIVSNPESFERYEDHEAALHFHLNELIKQAIAEGEMPIALIEDYLEVSYNDGNMVNEISDFLMHTDTMQSALGMLKESWHQKQGDTVEEGLFFGQGISEEEITQKYAQITLRSYLETLSAFGK
ncbi:hypothetical protein [Aquimarina agarilytica]|uniref:hypothetical protein n=1 Tax=Aquimarina agarilytica TaxID=1087449 RepID=UPI00028A0998|nr:hypothetical protein [Aquimarina agarilytica]